MSRARTQQLPASVHLPTIRAGAIFGRITDEVRSSWLEIDGFAGWVNLTIRTLRRRFDRALGKSRWAQGWRHKGDVLDAATAIELYEQAHYCFLADHPEIVNWLCRTASDVYEELPTSVESGLDYGVQKTWSIHLQDIAVRRCLVRLGRRFEGKQLIELRSAIMDGFRLSTGTMPFHEPHEIVECESELAWWRPGTIEAFWQNNKVLLVDPDSLHLEPLLVGPRGTWCQLDQAVAILVPPGGGRRVRATAMQTLRTRSQAQFRQEGFLPVNEGYRMAYRQLVGMSVSELCA